jgi:hypothetical protein
MDSSNHKGKRTEHWQDKPGSGGDKMGYYNDNRKKAYGGPKVGNNQEYYMMMNNQMGGNNNPYEMYGEDYYEV